MAPRIPVRLANRDTEVLLDSGSMVTLVWPEFALGQKGDQKSYPTVQVEMVTSGGVCTFKAGVVNSLAVPVLVGRDCLVYERYWPLVNRKPLGRPKSQVKPRSKKPQLLQAFAAASDQESESESVIPEKGEANGRKMKQRIPPLAKSFPQSRSYRKRPDRAVWNSSATRP